MAHPILLNQALALCKDIGWAIFKRKQTFPAIPKHVFFPSTAPGRANEPDV